MNNPYLLQYEIYMSRITDFLTGRGTDNAGRTIDDVLAMTDEQLETVHDYIQWLFPLREPSRHVPDSPVLTAEDIILIRKDQMAQTHLNQATWRMKMFYRGTTHWYAPGDHNHQRITRILRSLRLLTSDTRAVWFYQDVALHRSVPSKTRYLWNTAVWGPPYYMADLIEVLGECEDYFEKGASLHHQVKKLLDDLDPQ